MFIQLKQPYFGKAIGERVDVDASHAQALITQGLAEAVQGDPLGDLVGKSMEKMLGNLTTSLDSAITAALQQFADAQKQARRSAVPAIFGEGQTGDVNHNFGDFCLAVATGNRKRLEEEYKSYPVDDKGLRVKAAMAE